jgi:hypothetical protein
MAKTFQSHPDAGRPEFRRGTKSWARYTRYQSERGALYSLHAVRAPAKAWTKAGKLFHVGVHDWTKVRGRAVRACLHDILQQEWEHADSLMGDMTP